MGPGTLVRVTQQLPSERLDDVGGAARAAFQSLALGPLNGRTVGLTVGSRGIASVGEIVGTLIRAIVEHGGRPLLIAAMGSHGGATEAGQRKVLERLGITEALGAELDCSMGTLEVGAIDGLTVYWARATERCDGGVVIVGRVKPHTAFVGRVESGLCKMAAIGLGKAEGAREMHGAPRGLERSILDATELLLSRNLIAGGIGIVEDAYHRVACVEGFRPNQLIAGDVKLLERAKALMPTLPFTRADFVWIQRMGKNISGTGVDPNIIGKRPGGYRCRPLPRPGQTEIGLVSVSDLTPESGGNAVGIGFAELATARLRDKIDMSVTEVNAQTTYSLETITMPEIAADDRDLLAKVSARYGGAAWYRLAGIFIRDTLTLDSFFVTEPLADTLRHASPPYEAAFGEEVRAEFDDSGHLRLHWRR